MLSQLLVVPRDAARLPRPSRGRGTWRASACPEGGRDLFTAPPLPWARCVTCRTVAVEWVWPAIARRCPARLRWAFALLAGTVRQAILWSVALVWMTIGRGKEHCWPGGKPKVVDPCRIGTCWLSDERIYPKLYLFYLFIFFSDVESGYWLQIFLYLTLELVSFPMFKMLYCFSSTWLFLKNIYLFGCTGC